MDKPKVFVSRIIPEAGLRRVQEFCDADVWQDELPPPRQVLLDKVKGKQGLLSLLTDQIDGTLLDSEPGLKVISQFAVGFDNIDIPEATKRGIPVGHTPGVLTDTTADFAWTLLMAAARRVVEGADYVRAGKWRTWGPTLLLGQDVSGATLGVIGFGRIGQGMARRASGFGMRVLFYDSFLPDDAARRLEKELDAQRTDLDTLLRESDFVSLHTDLNETTHHLMNAQTLGKMKRTAVLINSSRGPVVDTQALYEALKNGTLFAAGLDVTDPEPLPADHPLVHLPNCVIAPHTASASVVTRDKMATMAANNLIAGLKGERLPHCANPQVYEQGV